VQFAQTQRLLLAKRLLHDSSLPVTDVALASGFGSLRRFNALFKARYRLSPSRLRSTPALGGRSDVLIFELGYRPPLDWTALSRFLAHRAIEGVERLDGHTYLRTVQVERGTAHHAGWIAVAPVQGKAALRVALSPSLARVVPTVLARVKRVFDLACDPEQIAASLGPLGRRNPGLRLPGAFDGFEVAVRAVLGQQITVKAARTLAGRFAAAFGEPVETPFEGMQWLFPSARRIAGLEFSEVAAQGIIGSRAKSIVALARAIDGRELLLEPGVELDKTIAGLRALPGVGEWTAQYVAMRALCWPDAFPHTDYGVLKAMREKDPRRVLARAEAWRPWRAYAVMHLWRSLEER
jgi:AraC family transcriptional regulator of adaptative response / DNA-3-methyladenine glycosylase II